MADAPASDNAGSGASITPSRASSSLLEFWTGRLEEDVLGFADPETDLRIASGGNELCVAWEQRGRTREERFRLSQSGDFRWIRPDGDPSPYDVFLSSAGMADFDQLAQAMARVFTLQPDFVATDADMELPSGEEIGVTASPDVLRDEVIGARGSAEGRTSLFFIKGDAGAGKTTLLKELTAAQAKKYVRGETRFLFFYVSAQGRALSNLRDAFSGELQDLRAGFTRDAVPALARSGLLVPVIDGFDELLGAAGYGDAFNSLRQFLIELKGLGVVVVSARSAFYNVEFISRAPDVSEADLSLRPVSLQPWNDDQLREYLERRRPAAADERDHQVLADLGPRDRGLLTKPFFASEFPGYVEARRHGSTSSDGLLDFLINAYIKRESEKILGASGEPVLSTEGHATLLEEAAEHMWQTEKRQLSVDELQTLVEMVAEMEGLRGDESRQLITKVTSSAGFRTNGSSGTRLFTFDHEVYFEYFLSRSLGRQFGQPDYLGPFFDRGVLPGDVVDTAIRDQWGPALVQDVLATTSAAIRHENRRRNAGAVVAACARHHGPIENIVVRNAAFINVDFGPAVFNGVEFDNCEFTGARLDEARFEDCVAATSRFQGVVVTNESRLGIAGIVPGANFGSLIHPDVPAEVFSPHDVAEVLRRLSAPLPGAPERTISYSPRAQVLIKLLETMARAYRRANILFESDEHLTRLFRNEHWPALREALTSHGVVREEERAVSGPKVSVYRLLVRVDELVSGENARELPPGPIADFWSALRSL